MMDPALNPWDILPTQALIDEAGGMILLRPSQVPGKVDSLFGNRALVQHIARELSF
jgi:fructose-1,6-bisphosphatase/inositol monophosphatase family enzyme